MPHTPYFRNVAVKKDTQSFLTAPLPTSLSSGKKESINGSYNIVDRSRAKGANEKGRSCDLPFRWLPLLGSNHATLFRYAQRRVCFLFYKRANVAQRNKLRNHDILPVRAEQKKEKQKRATVWLLSFVWARRTKLQLSNQTLSAKFDQIYRIKSKV